MQLAKAYNYFVLTYEVKLLVEIMDEEIVAFAILFDKSITFLAKCYETFDLFLPDLLFLENSVLKLFTPLILPSVFIVFYY